MTKLDGVIVAGLEIADVGLARIVAVEVYPRNEDGIPVVVRGSSRTNKNGKIIGHAQRAAVTPGSTMTISVEQGKFKILILDLS